MLYVLDASVVIKWLVPELLSDRAERFIAAFRAGRLDFIAPDILSAEVGHSLGRLVVRRELATMLASMPSRATWRSPCPRRLPSDSSAARPVWRSTTWVASTMPSQPGLRA